MFPASLPSQSPCLFSSPYSVWLAEANYVGRGECLTVMLMGQWNNSTKPSSSFHFSTLPLHICSVFILAVAKEASLAVLSLMFIVLGSAAMFTPNSCLEFLLQVPICFTELFGAGPDACLSHGANRDTHTMKHYWVAGPCCFLHPPLL